MIRLENINESNWRIPLSVSEAQKQFVANSSTILARAYAYREARSRAFLVVAGGIAVGMGLYHDDSEMDAYIFSELFIDQRYQGKGYGKAATRLVLDGLRQDGRFRKVVLCYIEGNEAAKNLYEGFGFVETERDEDEIIMELEL